MDETAELAAINTAQGTPPPASAGVRRLALCFDGTWNDLDSQTNVARLFRAIGTTATGCADQLSFYDSGVGTRPLERVRGGMFGVGLDRNVLEGYCWLCNNYRAGEARADADDPGGEAFDRGDRIFLFGFSRGAFTARSLAGLINRLGVLDRTRVGLADGELFTPRTAAVREAWDLYRKALPDTGTAPRDMAECVAFRARAAVTVKIAMVGVWDTVGALGVPKFRAPIPLPTGGSYRFHDTALGRVIETAYQAIGIDEQRCDYMITLWTRPSGRLWAREVEQRWFPGAHANVGGGYDGDLLCDPPLLWMAQKAAAQGLAFNGGAECLARAPADFALDGSEYLTPVRDSYAEFMHGLYRFVSPVVDGGRALRRMMVESDGLNQVVDPTAWLKWDADASYRPANLARSGRSDSLDSGGGR